MDHNTTLLYDRGAGPGIDNRTAAPSDPPLGTFRVVVP